MGWRQASILLVAWGLAGAAFAQDYGHGRIVDVEPGVTVQRATEPAADEAIPNLPFLPGDRVWTDSRGRAEFQFADGTLVRLDSRSKLDYVAHEEGRSSDRIVLRLWSGQAYVDSRHGRGKLDFAVETPDAVIEAGDRGLFRVEALPSLSRVSVREGSVSMDAGDDVDLRAGEQAEASGRRVSDPVRFADAGDDFDRWNDSRDTRVSWGGSHPRSLPEDVLPYAAELDGYGSWVDEPEYGSVWQPAVAADWQPYANGRWIWSPYGYTWVAAEPWGWAPFHYGRWDFSPARGWFWIPSSGWGPGWVSWAVGSNYVGWCPLGRHDRPVRLVYEERRGRSLDRGHAIPRDSWVYARRDQVAASGPVRPLELRAVAREVRVIDAPRARPTRDFSSVLQGFTSRTGATIATSGSAVPAGVSRARTRAAISDTVPEMRRAEPPADFPTARRRPVGEAAQPLAAARPSWRQDPPASEPPAAEVSTGRVARERMQPRDGDAGSAPVASPSAYAGLEDRPKARARDQETDREVLRKLFRPADSRPSSGDDGARARPADRVPDEGRRRGGDDGGSASARPRSAGSDGARPVQAAPPPRSAPPPPPPPPAAQREHARPRPRGDGDHP